LSRPRRNGYIAWSLPIRRPAVPKSRSPTAPQRHRNGPTLNTPAPTAAAAPLLEITLDADAILGYASIQCGVPVVRSLVLVHAGDAPLEDLQVEVACNPPFARGVMLRFDRLQPGERRHVAPLDLPPDHAFLANLAEAVQASITVAVRTGDRELARATQAVEVLAYDQWAGTRSLPELLAAFSMPNDPAVDSLVGKASQLLKVAQPGLSMDGYQSKRREAVWQQVSALYTAVCNEGLQYVEPPASFGTDGQKVRTPGRILEHRVGSCLDLAMLFASCLEQAGLGAVVLLKEGHAWIGAWLHDAAFPDPLVDDVQSVRKRVASGELLVFETTGVAQHPTQRPSLRIALEQGQGYLADGGQFLYAIDIRRARAVHIRPLPSRSMAVDGPGADTDKGAAGGTPAAAAAPIEPMPDLPPLDPALLRIVDAGPDDTPEGRLSKWKSKLLDLTLRNRLLNFKPSKSTLRIAAPDLAALEDALSDGGEFRLRAEPEIMDGKDPRSSEVHRNRTGQTPWDEMARNALADRELLVRLLPEDLSATLTNLFRKAREGLEEGGANTLFLAFGLLRWTDTERAEASHLAPILLVPVTLLRQSVRSGFRLVRHDDDAIVNPTLLQMMRLREEIRIGDLGSLGSTASAGAAAEALPTDDKGIDVARLLQAFRLAVTDLKQWEVLDEAHLGLFSFTKYLMWKDLQDRTAQLKANRVVQHLIDRPGEAFVRDEPLPGLDRLDDTYAPQDILAPLIADSSQLKAICAIDAGRDLVLEGPPGTGKSQTITNLIAHLLAKGRTVLFVSEKLAALEVVHRRLEQIGLGPFCLELHSAKAKKAEIVRALGATLDIAARKPSGEWQREADRLGALRQSLNGLVDALHRAYPNGLTVFDAIGTCIAAQARDDAAPASPMPWPDPQVHDREALDALRELSRRMASLADPVGRIEGHPLAAIGHTEWSTSWQDDLLEAVHTLDAAIAAFQQAAQAVGAHLKLPCSGLSMDGWRCLDQLADLLLAAPTVPAGLARAAHDARARARIQVLARCGRARNAHWQAIGPGWTPLLAKLNAIELQAEWSQASATWWPKSALDKRSMRKRLAAFRDDGAPPAADAIPMLFEPLAAVNEEDQLLRSMQDDAQALLQEQFDGIATDWAAVAGHERWAKQFADSVTRVAGSDPAQTHALRATLQPLVAEDRALLRPDGPVGRALVEQRDAWRALNTALQAVEALAKTAFEHATAPAAASVTASALAPAPGAAAAGGALERIRSTLAGWATAHRRLQPWCLWRKVREQAIAHGLQGIVATLENAGSGRTVPLAAIASHFEYSYRHWWVKKTIDGEPLLRGFSSADHTRCILEFRDADARFQALTQAYIAAKLAAGVPWSGLSLPGADAELGRLRRELQKQRRHLPIRQLVQALPTLLPRLKPCLLMSPLSVAQYLDAGYAPFDLVVFDEASQITVWDAVGTIARGRQLVVVGDPKQLPPTNFFNKSTDNDDATTDEEQIEDLESILDECLGAGMNRSSLQWHYRSRHESLIAFSNVTYYESSLITFPSPVTNDTAVRYERVEGVYDRGGSRTNRIEAEAVVAAIERHYLDAPAAADGTPIDRKPRSIGVVTFNQPQQALIETLLDQRRSTNAELDRAISAASNEPLFIKNLENVQGDERDVICFSTTFGLDAAGRMTMNFGPLNGEGGHRRLNVAITRAREAVRIFSSLDPGQIDTSKVRAAGVRDLKHYLDFAIKGPRALIAQSTPTGREPESPFEQAVMQALRERGWDVHAQVGCSGYRIDLAVVDPNAPGRYLLGIECDGRTYHSGATARDRDRLRQFVLENLGWKIARVWSTDWWRDAEGEVDKLVACLRSSEVQAP
jgi:very-short-patch-repair endonuclease